MICVYCLGTNSKKITKEHLISRSVLELIFGSKIRNITRSEIWENKALSDYEHILKDVCEYCNNNLLSPYDNAGLRFVKKINKYYDGSNVVLDINFKYIMWLIKTHLNHLRIIPEKGTKNYYPIKQSIYRSIIRGHYSLFKHFKLFIEGWQGKPYFWDMYDPKRIQFFSYRSVHFPYQQILVSNFRIKWLNTFILLPSNLNYSNYKKRVNVTLDAMKDNWKFHLQEIILPKALKDKSIRVTKMVHYEDLLKIMRPIKNS